ncbi:unnamed protein product [Discosporangium mesarthrocarpum]
MEAEAELKSTCPKVSVEHLAIDYSHFDAAAQAKVAAAITNKDVGLLVNNVGVSYPFPKYFNEVTDAEMLALVDVNVNSTVWMTRIVLKDMISRKRGCIVNFASAAALNPTALLAGYAGAKGFIVKFSESLNVEMAPKGIHVQCQVPLLVATKLAKVRKPTWDKPSPCTYAKAAVRAIGYGAVESPYWSHKLQLWVMGSMPFSAQVVFNLHKSLRARGMKKLEAVKQQSAKQD